MRRRTEIPGDTVTETPAAELELRAAVSNSFMISASDLYSAGGAPADCAASNTGVSRPRAAAKILDLLEMFIIILRDKVLELLHISCSISYWAVKQTSWF